MGLALGIIVAALGAMLVWAFDADIQGLSAPTLGVALLALGIAASLLSLLRWDSWGGFGERRGRDDDRRG